MSRLATPRPEYPGVAVRLLAAALALLLPGAVAAQHPHGHDAGAAEPATHAEEGVRVELSITGANGGAVLERAPARVRLRVTDGQTGEPLAGAHPVAWIDLRRGGGTTNPELCGDKIERYSRGTLRFRPEVDLNSYYVLVLNSESQISVIDPLLQFGRSKLHTTILLPGPGEDWTSSTDARELYVTVPRAQAVVVANTESWDVVDRIAVGGKPGRIEMEPGEARLWVSVAAPPGGVVVIDRESREVVKRLELGAGPHVVRFTADGARAFVASRGAGTVTAVDVASLEVLRSLETGDGPVDLDVSPLTGDVYVAHEGDGTVAWIDAESLEVVGEIPLEPGLRALRFIPAGQAHHHDPGAQPSLLAGRAFFVVNHDSSRVHVLDAPTGVQLRSVEVFDNPDQVAFSANFAYIRATGSSEVTMVPLNDPTSGGIGAFDHFPAGYGAPAEASALGFDDAIVQAPEHADGVFVVAPAEKAIYYYHYMEGMPTPSGSMNNYGFEPKAVMLIERRLREVEPGVYEATVRLDHAAEHDLVFLLPEPRLVHCFPFAVRENPALREGDVALRMKPASSELRAGESLYRFELVNARTGERAAGIEDVEVLFTSPTGWHSRAVARPLPDGAYEVSVKPPDAGFYYVSFATASENVGLRDRPPLLVKVGDAVVGAR